MCAIITITEALDYVAGAIDRLNGELGLGLNSHGRRGGKAVWSVGDALIVKATEIGEHRCEVEAINFRRNPVGIGREAEAVWQQLADELLEVCVGGICASSNRQAAHALSQVPPYGIDYKWYERLEYLPPEEFTPELKARLEERAKWRADMERLTRRTLEEAVAEAFGAADPADQAAGEASGGTEPAGEDDRGSQDATDDKMAMDGGAAADEEGTQAPGREIVLQNKPSGRPPDEVYDQAYRQIEAGKNELEVYRWVCQQKGWSEPGKSERDAFKAALKRRRN